MSEDCALPVSDLLPDYFDKIGDLVGRDLRDAEATRRLGVPGFVWKAMDAPVSNAIHRALGADVLEMLGQIWSGARQLQAYKDARRHPKGKPEVLKLDTQRFSTSVHPVVQVSLPPHKLPPLRFTLELGAVFDVALLTILEGRVTAVSALECRFEAKLKYGEATLKSIEPSPMRPLHEFRFRKPGLAIP